MPHGKVHQQHQKSFVSVANYQIVGVADTVAGAETEYRRLLKESGKLNVESTGSQEPQTVTGNITAISTAVVGGNSAYYIKITGSDKIFIAPVSINDELPFMEVGKEVTITYTENTTGITVNEIK